MIEEEELAFTGRGTRISTLHTKCKDCIQCSHLMFRPHFIALLLGAAAPGFSAPLDLSKLPPAAGRTVDFATDIQPLFEKHCLECHGPEKQKSGWRVDVKETALHGGDNYAPNIRPGKSAES